LPWGSSQKMEIPRGRRIAKLIAKTRTGPVLTVKKAGGSHEKDFRTQPNELRGVDQKETGTQLKNGLTRLR